MGLIDDIRTKYILQPLAQYLVKSREDGTGVFEKASKPRGAVLRDQFPYKNEGSQRTKPGSAVDFKTLRRFAIQYDVARAAINRRKRQINQLEWDITSVEEDTKPNPSVTKDLRTQIKAIGGYRVRFRELLDIMIEDLLVLDALAIYKRPNVGGSLYSLKVVDAATIKLRMDESGDTPMPPEIAYKQYIRGQEVASFTADEMYYEMMNPRTDTPYGLSPLESLILSISTALKSEIYNLSLVTEGNIPEGFYSMPDSWTPDQIKEFQEIWDAALAGNSAAMARLKFMPKGDYTPAVKPDDIRYEELQKWILKKTCMLFEIQPQELGFTESVNRSTGEVQQEIGKETGLKPLAKFIEEIFTDVVQIDLGHPELQFSFTGLESTDERAEAETNEIRIRSGQTTVDEVRAEQGLKALGVDKPFVIGSPTFIDEESMQAKADAEVAANQAKAEAAQAATTQPPAQEATPAAKPPDAAQKSADVAETHVQLVTELRAFRKYALNRVKDGKALRKFESDILPVNVCDELNQRLTKAEAVDEVRAIFTEYMQDYQIDFIADIGELRQKLAKVL